MSAESDNIRAAVTDLEIHAARMDTIGLLRNGADRIDELEAQLVELKELILETIEGANIKQTELTPGKLYEDTVWWTHYEIDLDEINALKKAARKDSGGA